MSDTHELVLVRCHRGEDTFGKDESLELFLLEIGDGRVYCALSSQHQVNARLVLVHRV